jgi:hypothetical protein
VLTRWRDNLREKANIMVRMHPKDNEDRYEAVKAKFPDVPFTLAGDNLASDDSWRPTQDDISLLVNQLRHCDVIVNVASTMTLEGFTIDKPSINIGFTLGASTSARYPMEDYYKSRHYCDIIETGAAPLVNNYEELFAAIDEILDRNGYDVGKQRRILRRKCSFTDDSSDRINGFLQQYAAQKSSPVPRKYISFRRSHSALARIPKQAVRLLRMLMTPSKDGAIGSRREWRLRRRLTKKSVRLRKILLQQSRRLRGRAVKWPSVILQQRRRLTNRTARLLGRKISKLKKSSRPAHLIARFRIGDKSLRNVASLMGATIARRTPLIRRLSGKIPTSDSRRDERP